MRIDSVQFQIQTQKQSQLSTGNMFIVGSDMLSNVEGIAPVGPGFNEPHYCTDSEERCVSIGPSNRLDPLGSSLGLVYKVGVERGWARIPWVRGWAWGDKCFLKERN